METTQLTTVGATVAVDNARATISETFDSFLKLLTTQLRYQDPTSPMNSTEFTSQLVQFSQVEQQLEANDKLDSLIGLQGASQIAFAASLAGKYIEIAGDTTAYAGEGTLDYGYRMPAGAVDTTINIVDGSGRTVLTTGGEIAAGKHRFTWTGLTTDGTTAAAGDYRIQVIANDTDGEPLQVDPTIVSRVTGVDLEEGHIRLETGSFSVGLSDVLAIRDIDATG